MRSRVRFSDAEQAHADRGRGAASATASIACIDARVALIADKRAAQLASSASSHVADRRRSRRSTRICSAIGKVADHRPGASRTGRQPLRRAARGDPGRLVDAPARSVRAPAGRFVSLLHAPCAWRGRDDRRTPSMRDVAEVALLEREIRRASRRCDAQFARHSRRVPCPRLARPAQQRAS